MTKLSIIGSGTAGAIGAAHFARWTDCEIDWYYDSKIKTMPVGEGSLTNLPQMLFEAVDFGYDNLNEIDGTPKLGIHKVGWANDVDFKEHFRPGTTAYHFNAVKLQEFLFKKLDGRVNLIDRNVGSHDELDSDFVFDCKGFPKEFGDHHKSEYISVNAVYVTQCLWDVPKFNYTLTIAVPHGWVFGIPLNNRCAIGYMYNDQISTLDEIKEDVKNIFDRFGLNPSEKTLELHFNNYYRKQNFVGRSAYSGNTSFFLEPLEATSIGFMDQIQRMAMGHWFQGDSQEAVNSFYTQAIQEIENIIMLHYFAGSKYNTPFWDYAKDRGQKCMERAVKNPRFVEFYNNSKNYDFRNCLSTPIDKMMYGSWDQRIMNMNLKSLGLINKIDALLDNGV
jgi:hypothetical protein